MGDEPEEGDADRPDSEFEVIGTEEADEARALAVVEEPPIADEGQPDDSASIEIEEAEGQEDEA